MIFKLNIDYNCILNKVLMGWYKFKFVILYEVRFWKDFNFLNNKVSV